MELHIYNTETNETVAIIEGDTNRACEALAEKLYEFDSGTFAATYSPAYDCTDGLDGIADDCERHEA